MTGGSHAPSRRESLVSGMPDDHAISAMGAACPVSEVSEAVCAEEGKLEA